MRIRKADLADIAKIRSVAEQSFPDTYREILTPEQIAYMMEWMYSLENLRRQMDEGHVFFLAEEEGACWGYVSIEPEAGGVFHLQKLYVLPEVQGKGYGKDLFKEALSYARAQGARRVELNVNRSNRALDFYHKMGMQILRSGDFPIGNGFYMNDYIMGIEV